ncbi:hypothetical protein JL722_5475 [Aureococcus anophagefferens]|nr:hypothetical protein JL722_5475 [Aureococcus anophagefferens]
MSRNDILAGSIGGAVAKVFEHPLDTLKTRMQTSRPTVGALALAQRTTVASLYRGLGAPLLASGCENAILFTSFNATARLIHDGERDDMPFTRVLLAASVSAVAVSHLLTPVEYVKVRLQSAPLLANPGAALVAACADAISRRRRRPLQGHCAMLAREVPGNVAWFSGYELAARALTPANRRRSELATCAAGAFAGMAYWAVPYPVDTVKSSIVAGTHGLPRASRRPWRTSRKALRRRRSAGAVPLLPLTVARRRRAILFTVYEAVQRRLSPPPK